ncbi:MAG: metallophosphoesterase [Pirellulales bacterium]
MKRVAWLTDIHLNFLAAFQRHDFLNVLAQSRPDVLLIGGDVAEALDLLDHLGEIAEAVPCPIYFVLGNHDYYHGSIRRVREQVRLFCREHPRLTWLSDAGVVELTSGTALVGHDGWADGRLGDYERSLVLMNDYRLIEELSHLGKLDRWQRLKALGDEAADHIRAVLPAALEAYPHVFLLTHVPPLREACWYQGRPSNDEWAPHFTCYAMGQALLQIMRDHPERHLTVFCGHTHSPGECRPLSNLRILTGAAEYGRPRIQQVFELE